MRHTSIALFCMSLLSAGLTGCVPGFGLLPGEDVPGVFLPGAPEVGGGKPETTGEVKPVEPASTPPAPDPVDAGVVLTGALAGLDAYELYELPGADVGERLVVENGASGQSRSLFTVALFDAELNLLVRTASFPVRDVAHVFRRPSSSVFVGIVPTYDDSGGEYRLRVRREAGVAPAPRRQIVYLNFEGASNLDVHTRRGLSFGPFDAGVLGEAYAGQTDAVRRAIVETMRADFAAYDVEFVSSDEGRPAGEYSVVHFGGAESGLLGLADSVDRYNENPTQDAVVYVASFAPFQVMELTPEEMGMMIGNVGSHELGHLLGLYHTRNPSDVMDTTGTAWDLASEQRFSRAPLEPSVFPVGQEDSPVLLADTVGQTPFERAALRSERPEKLALRSAVRGLVELEIPRACGLCLDPEK